MTSFKTGSAAFAYLTHYYVSGELPFHSLMDLPVVEARAIMSRLFEQDSPFTRRFKDPDEYLRDRKLTERWLRLGAASIGARITSHHPIYLILGDSHDLLERADPNIRRIEVELAVFEETDLTFTYPDSMFSFWLAQTRPPDRFDAELHGRVLSMRELMAIMKRRQQDWGKQMPDSLGLYIEAQVWNTEKLDIFRNALKTQNRNA